jgi:hypothetical protein
MIKYYVKEIHKKTKSNIKTKKIFRNREGITMMIKKTGDYKKDFKKIRGYEVEGHYFDGTNSFVVWKKKFWRDKTSDAEYKNVLKQLKEQVKEVRKHQKEAYGKE